MNIRNLLMMSNYKTNESVDSVQKQMEAKKSELVIYISVYIPHNR